MTAAYYKGKHNLDSAKRVLEAGIDMAVQVGVEADTKPFWHLLGQINNIIQARCESHTFDLSNQPSAMLSFYLASPITSIFTLTPMTPSVSFAENSSPGSNEVAYIQPNIHQPGKPSPMKGPCFSQILPGSI